mgnify:CR=1 FL=1
MATPSSLTAALTYSPTGSSGSNGPYTGGTLLTITANFNLNVNTGGGTNLPILQLTDSSNNTLFGGTGAAMTRINSTKFTLQFTVHGSSVPDGTITVSISNATSTAASGGYSLSSVSNNTFTLDNTAPTLNITQQVVQPTVVSGSPYFNIYVNEAGTLTTNITQADTITGSNANVLGDVYGNFATQLSLNAGNRSAKLALLKDGTYSGKTITFTDSAGNATTATLNNFTIDTVTPTLSITQQIDPSSNDTTPSFDISVNKAGTLSTNITSADTTTNTANVFTSPSLGATISLASGNHQQITFAALNDATYSGKTITFTDNYSRTVTQTFNNFKIDTGPPTLSITQQIDASSNNNTPSFDINVNEAGTLSTSINSSDTSNNTANVFTSPNSGATLTLASGTHTITFAALKNATYSNETITFTDEAGNATSQTLTDFEIDTDAPTISSISAITDHYYPTETFNINVQLSESVIVSNLSSTSLTLNTTPSSNATFSSHNTSTNVLVYSYTVISATSSGTLDVTAFNLGSATIKDSGNNSLITSLPTGTNALSNSSVVIDGSAPTLSIVSHVPVTSSQKTNDNTPSFVIQSNHIGDISTNITPAPSNTAYNAADLNNNKTFTFNNSLADALYSNNKVEFINKAGTSSGVVTLNNFTVDTLLPEVTDISASSEKNTFKNSSSSAITIEVTFNEDVTVKGTPTLIFNTGDAATYAGAQGNKSTKQLFTLSSFTGNAKPLSATGFNLTGSVIEDDASNNVATSLASLSTASNLDQENIEVDNTPPSLIRAVVDLSSVPAAQMNLGVVSVGTRLSVELDFSEPVIPSSVADTAITLNDTNGTVLDLSSVAHSDDVSYNTLIFEKFLDSTLVTSKRDIEITALTLSNSATLRDQTGNDFNNSISSTNTVDISSATAPTTKIGILNKPLFISSTVTADDGARLQNVSATNFFVTHSDSVDVSFNVWPNLTNPSGKPNSTIKLLNGTTQLDVVDLSAGTLSSNDSIWTGSFKIPSSGVMMGQNITLTITDLENSINSQLETFTNVSNFQKTIEIDISSNNAIIDISGQDSGWESELDISSNNTLNPLTRAKESDVVKTILDFTEEVPQPEFYFRSGTTTIPQNRLTYTATATNPIIDTDFNITYSDQWTITYTTSSTDDEGVISWYMESEDVAGNQLRSPSTGYQNTSIEYDRTAPSITSIIASANNPKTPITRFKTGNRVDISLNISESLSQATGSSPTIEWGIFSNLTTAKAAPSTSWNNIIATNSASGTVVTPSIVGGDDTVWEATGKYWPGDGDLYLRSNITDLADNNTVDISRAGALVVDNTSPTLQFVDISSNNDVSSNRATNGDIITFRFKTDNNEPLDLSNSPVVVFYLGNGGSTIRSHSNNGTATNFIDVSTNDGIIFDASYTVQSQSIQNGLSADALTYQIITNTSGYKTKDRGNNLVNGIGTPNPATSNLRIDVIPPTIPTPGDITITTNNASNHLATNGDTITLTFTTDESLSSADVIIDGSAASVTLATSLPWTHTATHTLNSTRRSTTGEVCNFDISGITDMANNEQTTNYTRASTQTARFGAGNKNVTIDNSGQLISLTSFVKSDGDKFDNTKIRSGDNAKLIFSLPSVTVTDGSDAEFLSSNTVTFFDSLNNMLGTANASVDASGNYVTDFIIPSHNPPTLSVIDGTMQFSIDASDNVGNDITFPKTSFGSLDIDNTAPVIVAANVSILSLDDHPGSANQPVTDPSNARVGDTVRMTFVSNETLKNATATGAVDNSKNSIIISSGGTAITNTPTLTFLTTSSTDDTIRAEYVVHNNDTDGDISFNLTYYDLAGNESSAIRGTTFLMPTVVIDTTAPTLVSLDISSNRTFILDPSRAVATDHSEHGDIVTIEVQYSESIHAPTITMYPSTGATSSINLSVTDVLGNGTFWRARNTMTHTQPTGDISFNISHVYDLAGNTLASVNNTHITTGNSVKHYFGRVNIIPRDATLKSDDKFLDIYEDKLSPGNEIQLSKGVSILSFDKGIISAFDPVLGDVTSKVTSHDITTAGGSLLIVEYRYTDSIGRVFRARRQISVGDPYIIPAFGEIYKLPDIDKIYRLYQHNNVYVNASVKKATKEKESQILDYYENIGGNKNLNQEIITDGYYYEKFFIKSNNNYMLFDFKNNDIKYSEKAEEYFNIEIHEKENDPNSFYSGDGMKLNITFDVDNEKMGFSILLFKNPQIDNGIEVLNNVSKDSIGLLVRNYKPSLFEIDNIKSTKNINLDKQKNNLIENNIVFEEEEIFENLKE